MTLTFNEKYQAILRKDPTYEGLFITAVKTTGIFCRPVCSARKPNRENVEFFNSIDEAMQQGYRPCKVCRPMEQSGKVPAKIAGLLQSVQAHPHIKVKDKDLRDNGLEPNMVRRWFKQNYGITFQAYQRKLRIATARTSLLQGNTVTHTAYDHGFDSLSGFNQGYQKVFGKSPSTKDQVTAIHQIRFTTPLGPMFACADEQGLCLLDFTDRKDIDQKLVALQKSLGGVILPGTNQHLQLIEHQLRNYFAGRLKKFTVKLRFQGTEFQKMVWSELQVIPYGETRTYGQQALAIGRPTAVRAVAAANGQNSIAIVVPCHRVIGSDGSLRGFAGGLSRKKWLLEHEKALI